MSQYHQKWMDLANAKGGSSSYFTPPKHNVVSVCETVSLYHCGRNLLELQKQLVNKSQ